MVPLLSASDTCLSLKILQLLISKCIIQGNIYIFRLFLYSFFAVYSQVDAVNLNIPRKHIILNVCISSYYKYTSWSLLLPSPQILLSPQPRSQSPKSSYWPHLSHWWPRNNNNTPNTQMCVTSRHVPIYPHYIYTCTSTHTIHLYIFTVKFSLTLYFMSTLNVQWQCSKV